MRFMLDENVPVSVAERLTALGHQADFIKDYVPEGSPDPLVATVSESLDAVLISFDGDFEKIAPRVPEGEKARFKKLSRIWMKCFEPKAAQRIEIAIDLIQSEHALASAQADTRMFFWVGGNYLKTHR
jgi:predicted nuclease of predicted toxin-antitoxin system